MKVILNETIKQLVKEIIPEYVKVDNWHTDSYLRGYNAAINKLHENLDEFCNSTENIAERTI